MRKLVSSVLAICAVLAVSTVASAGLVDSATSSPGTVYGANPSPASITDTIVVAGSPVTSITLLTVTITQSHGWVGDNEPVVLTKQGGPSVTLYSKPGSADGTGFGDSSDLCTAFPITFADAAVALAENMGAVPNLGVADCIGNPALNSPSTVHPTAQDGSLTFLAAFIGQDFNGTWELSLTDTYPAFTGGTLNSWTINVEGVPEPTTIALVGLGALALIKRRRS